MVFQNWEMRPIFAFDSRSGMYWCYPPTVLNNLHSIEAIPPQYWSYPPTVLSNLHSTEAIAP